VIQQPAVAESAGLDVETIATTLVDKITDATLGPLTKAGIFVECTCGAEWSRQEIVEYERG
jgi:hypothetical protein